MQPFPSRIAPTFKVVTPNSSDNPALESVEEFPNVGFTEIVAPSPYDRVDGVDEFKDGQRNASACPGSDGVPERLD